ncbi:MAG: PPOX class F420-dependent oxidoreductase [Candidatus Dormiibacterota bacterium]
MSFTDAELEYLRSQRLGRLATIAPDGSPQNNPVGFQVNEEAGTIDIGGWNMGSSRKFRNVEANPQVAFVVDDLASVKPWKPRGVQVRGTAEALSNQGSGESNMGEELIRVHPRRVLSWGLGADGSERSRRTIDNSTE